jgi:hypothetical protein
MDRDFLRNNFRHTKQRPQTPARAVTPPAPLPIKKSAQLDLFWKIIICLSLLIAISSGAYTVYLVTHQKTHTQVIKPAADTKAQSESKSPEPSVASASTPKEAATKSKATLFYPSALPSGYASNNDFEVIDDKVTIYSLKDAKGNTYSITLQPMPANFNLDTYASKLTSVEKFTAPVGSAVIGVNRSEIVASIQTTQKTWILINATDTSLRPQLEAIVKSMQPVAG